MELKTRGDYRRIVPKNFIFPLLLMTVLIHACGSSVMDATEKSTGSLAVEAVLPNSILNLGKDAEVQVEIQMGPSFEDMAVDLKKGTAAIVLEDIAAGENIPYKLDIVLKTNNTTLNAASSIENESIVTIKKSETTYLKINKYIFNDEDSDGFSNVGELIAGTNWMDSSDFPHTSDVRLSNNYILVDHIGAASITPTSPEIPFIEFGAIAPGTSKTASYRLK